MSRSDRQKWEAGDVTCKLPQCNICKKGWLDTCKIYGTKPKKYSTADSSEVCPHYEEIEI